MKQLKTMLLLFLVVVTTPVFADGQGKIPWQIGAAIYVVQGIIAVALAIIYSYLYKLLYEWTRGEKREGFIWMALCTLAFPSLFTFWDNVSHIVYKFYITAYTVKISNDDFFNQAIVDATRCEIIYKSIIVLTTFTGFNVGYFIAKKREPVALSIRTKKEKRLAILVQLIFSILLPSIIFYFSIRKDTDRIRTHENAKMDRQL